MERAILNSIGMRLALITAISAITIAAIQPAAGNEFRDKPPDGLQFLDPLWTPPATRGMSYIPAGAFEMGDHHNDAGFDDLPLHVVFVDSFYMDTYEVTNQKYAAALNWAMNRSLVAVTAGIVHKPGDTNTPYCETTSSNTYTRITWNGSKFGVVSGREWHPISMVTWYGAAAYANWRSAMRHLQPSYDTATWDCDFDASGYRLPTEAEWEMAARGGEYTPYYRYPWGDTIDGSKANYGNSGDPYDELWPEPETTPVGYYNGSQTPAGTDMANGYGLYDMSGNVWEWCNDWYDSAYYSSSPYDNPTGPPTGTYRVFRGGSWGNTGGGYRCSDRNLDLPEYGFSTYGFRLVLD